MPKKVMKKVHRNGRFPSFLLWPGTNARSRKAPVMWEQTFLPTSYEGWNLHDLCLWNKVVVTKHCWALSLKQIVGVLDSCILRTK